MSENVSFYCRLALEIVLKRELIANTLCRPLNFTYNPHLQSIRSGILTENMNQIDAEMFSMIPSNNITTVEIDTRWLLLHNFGVHHLRHLDAILASGNFSRLSTILIRVEYELRYMITESINLSANILHDAFPLARSRGILQIRHKCPNGIWKCW